jgi:HEAT repeat protein
MSQKLPKELIKELDELSVQLTKGTPEERDVAMSRLGEYEKSGTISIDVLMDMAGHVDPSLRMYAIMALGRNGSARAVRKLQEMAQELDTGNVLLLETVVDALGQTGDKEVIPLLLSLLGIQTKGWTSRLLGRLGKRKDEPSREQLRRRDHLTLPVIRALEKIPDAQAAELLGEYLEHDDPFVRWHTIQILVKTNFGGYNDSLKRMAESDQNNLVREMAEIALQKIQGLPPHMNN